VGLATAGLDGAVSLCKFITECMMWSLIFLASLWT